MSNAREAPPEWCQEAPGRGVCGTPGWEQLHIAPDAGCLHMFCAQRAEQTLERDAPEWGTKPLGGGGQAIWPGSPTQTQTDGAEFRYRGETCGGVRRYTECPIRRQTLGECASIEDFFLSGKEGGTTRYKSSATIRAERYNHDNRAHKTAKIQDDTGAAVRSRMTSAPC